jgi:hypothetical protein
MRRGVVTRDADDRVASANGVKLPGTGKAIKAGIGPISVTLVPAGRLPSAARTFLRNRSTSSLRTDRRRMGRKKKERTTKMKITTISILNSVLFVAIRISKELVKITEPLNI